MNIFLGRNGQGKSNLLEGLSWLSLGRSLRAARDRECIAFGKDEASLLVEGTDAAGDPTRLEARLRRDGRRSIRVNGQTIERQAELVGLLPVVQFDPDEVDLAKGSPDSRRRFLDQTLCMASGEYLRQLVDYRRAAAQKNRLLKQGRHLDAAQLAVWDHELVATGVPLLVARAALLPELEEVARAAYAELAPEGGRLGLAIRSTVLPRGAGRGELETGEVQARFAQALADVRERERVLGHALAGPHRDRLEIELKGRSLRRYGSQGEMRSASIALKLAQGELLYRRMDERPAVFLDDIFSELDRVRTHSLQSRLHREHQLFIATARVDDVVDMEGWEDTRAWLVDDGRLSRIDDLGAVGEWLSSPAGGADGAP